MTPRNSYSGEEMRDGTKNYIYFLSDCTIMQHSSPPSSTPDPAAEKAHRKPGLMLRSRFVSTQKYNIIYMAPATLKTD